MNLDSEQLLMTTSQAALLLFCFLSEIVACGAAFGLEDVAAHPDEGLGIGFG